MRPGPTRVDKFVEEPESDQAGEPLREKSLRTIGSAAWAIGLIFLLVDENVVAVLFAVAAGTFFIAAIVWKNK